jgi:hypothetical protein
MCHSCTFKVSLAVAIVFGIMPVPVRAFGMLGIALPPGLPLRALVEANVVAQEWVGCVTSCCHLLAMLGDAEHVLEALRAALIAELWRVVALEANSGAVLDALLRFCSTAVWLAICLAHQGVVRMLTAAVFAQDVFDFVITPALQLGLKG